MTARTPKELELKIVADYQAGETGFELAKKYEKNDTTIYRILKSYGVERRPYNIPLTEEVVSQAIELYIDGLEWNDIADALGVSKAGILKRMKAEGIVFDRASKVNYELSDEVIKLFTEDRKQTYEIAKILNITTSSVYSILRKSNIDLDHRRKWVFDYDFFNKNTVEAAYFAGFLLADGNIHKGNRQGDDWTLKLCIHQDDISVLQKFCDAINLDRQAIKHRLVKSSKAKSGTSPCVYISIIHSGLEESLKRWGIVPNKTYNYSEPTVPEYLIGPFLTGWTDGDGCLYYRKIGNCLLTHFTVVGNKDGVKWFDNALRIIGYKNQTKITGEPEKVYSRIDINSTKSIARLTYLMQVRDCPYLPRKWDKILAYCANSTNFNSIDCIK